MSPRASALGTIIQVRPAKTFLTACVLKMIGIYLKYTQFYKRFAYDIKNLEAKLPKKYTIPHQILLTIHLEY